MFELKQKIQQRILTKEMLPEELATRQFPIYREGLGMVYSALIPLNDKWKEYSKRDFYNIASGMWNIEDIISFMLKYKSEYPCLVDFKWKVWNQDHYGLACPFEKEFFIYSEDM